MYYYFVIVIMTRLEMSFLFFVGRECETRKTLLKKRKKHEIGLSGIISCIAVSWHYTQRIWITNNPLLRWIRLYYLSSCYKKSITGAHRVVYLCIIFVCMHSIFALPGWHHKCSLKKERVSHFGLVYVNKWYNQDK